MDRFRTCDECSRHVRAIEAKCPFCGHALAAPELTPVPRAPAQLSRAQRIALVAAVAGGLAACGDDTGPSKPSGQGVAGATAGMSSTAGTGAVAGTGAAGRGAAGQVAVPVYGAPVPPYGIPPVPPPPPAGSGGSGGADRAGQGGGSASAGQGGAGGAGGGAGDPASAGRGGAIAMPLYGASPAYGLPATPSPKK